MLSNKLITYKYFDFYLFSFECTYENILMYLKKIMFIKIIVSTVKQCRLYSY